MYFGLEPAFSIDIPEIGKTVISSKSVAEPCGAGTLASNPLSKTLRERSQSRKHLLSTTIIFQ